MPIEFNCPACQSRIRTPDGSGGKMARCPQCGAVATVPAGPPGPPASPPAAGPVSTPASGWQPHPPPGFSANPPARSPAFSPPPAPQAPPNNPYAPASLGAAPNPFRDGPVNPYASPASAADPAFGKSLAERARSKLIIPAVGLIATCLIGLGFLSLAGIGLAINPAAINDAPNDPAERAGFFVALVGIFGGGLLIHLLQILGAISMLRVRNRGLALAGVIASAIPCDVYCCWFTLPFAIWAGIVLAQPDVRDAFR